MVMVTVVVVAVAVVMEVRLQGGMCGVLRWCVWCVTFGVRAHVWETGLEFVVGLTWYSGLVGELW